MGIDCRFLARTLSVLSLAGLVVFAGPASAENAVSLRVHEGGDRFEIARGITIPDQPVQQEPVQPVPTTPTEPTTTPTEIAPSIGHEGCASETKIEQSPVWDTLVLYRANTENWRKYAKGEDLKGNYDSGKSLVGGKLSKMRTGPQAKSGKFKSFSNPGCNELVDWILGQGDLYRSLVNKVSSAANGRSNDAIVVMTRVNPKTGAREYKADLWKGFGDPKSKNNPNLLDASKGKVGKQLQNKVGKDLANNWQTDDHKTITVGGEEHDINVVGCQTRASPIILDLGLQGTPDLLAGPEWRKDRDGGVNPTALRRFDLDGKGAANWEWVGAKAGLLVWSEIGTEFQPTARNLLGTAAFGKKWADGYAALATLDTDGDGQLTGKELDKLAVWVDGNTDAVAQSGEIRTVADRGITTIGVKAERDAKGNAQLAAGFVTKEGRTGASWDWWSNRGPIVPANVSVYKWRPIEDEADVPGGNFVFVKEEGQDLRMVSFVPAETAAGTSDDVAVGIPFQVARHGEKLQWSNALANGEVLTDAVLENGHIVGVTRVVRDGKEESRYGWVAVPKSGNTL